MNHDIMGDPSGIVKNLPIPSPNAIILGKREDLAGKTYGRLTVISPSPEYKWLCVCTCGNKRDILASNLKTGTTKSCGCLLGESRVTQENITHGLSKHHLYPIWKEVLNRCRNPNNAAFHHYGGRGIDVDPSWLNIENFLQDMGPSFQKGLTLERADNSRGYSKENCKWVTMQEQARNRRNSKFITYKGETKLLIEWCEGLGLKYSTITTRLHRGWTTEQAFELPRGAKSPSNLSQTT